jgi:hypothetical protein
MQIVTLFCPKCPSEIEIKEPCKRCHETGWITKTRISNLTGLEIETAFPCPKCKGRKFLTSMQKIRSEMVYFHPQVTDPARWICRRCAFQMYVNDKTGFFERPELQLPPLDNIALKEQEKHPDNKDAVKEYIKRRFGP